MNNLQRSRILNLSYAKMLASHKEFVRNLEQKSRYFDGGRKGMLLSEAQHMYLAKLAWRYKRQLPCSCVPRQDPKYMSQSDIQKEMSHQDKESENDYA